MRNVNKSILDDSLKSGVLSASEDSSGLFITDVVMIDSLEARRLYGVSTRRIFVSYADNIFYEVRKSTFIYDNPDIQYYTK